MKASAEVCSNIFGRFPCVPIAHIRGFAAAVSDQARATIAKADCKQWTAPRVKPTSGFCLRAHLHSLGLLLKGRMNGLPDTPKIIRSGLVLHSLSNTTISQGYSMEWLRTDWT